jgi:hypothetical protein
MHGVTGPMTADIDTCEDLSTLVTFGAIDMYPTDTTCFTAILVTSRDDEDGTVIRESVDLANNFIDNHPELKQCSGFDFLPGDANTDGVVNVADAVYIINYLFLYGPPPSPYPNFSCDANGDCAGNVGDAVYIISHVFKGGPAPVTLDQWVNLCGWPPY